MELQTELLMNSVEEEVVLPMINDFQEPLMHMPIVENGDNILMLLRLNSTAKRGILEYKEPNG